MKPPAATDLSLNEFLRVDLRVGTVLTAAVNPRAHKPALALTVDFGELGTRASSAQLTGNYAPETLVGRQAVAVVNFPPRQVAGVNSEVLVLAAVDPDQGTILLQPERPVTNGTRIL